MSDHIPNPPTPDESKGEMRACIAGMNAITLMLIDLEDIVRCNVACSQIKEPGLALPWGKFNSYRWTAMQEARRSIAAIMDNLGDTLNGCDGADEFQVDATTFAFEIMHKLAEADATSARKVADNGA